MLSPMVYEPWGATIEPCVDPQISCITGAWTRRETLRVAGSGFFFRCRLHAPSVVELSSACGPLEAYRKMGELVFGEDVIGKERKGICRIPRRYGQQIRLDEGRAR
jgi:hypothetical protein